MITRKVQPKSLLLILLAASLCRTQSLKIVTVNLWTGLDYHGTLAIGAYESPEVREKRLSAVEQMLLSVHPDVVALQEVNPAARIARRFAESCDYDVVYQRVNSGLKIGSFGIPWNLNEGVAILARKELMLQFVDVWSLSDSPGIIGNSCSLHSDEHDIGLVCTINVRGVPIVLVNVHTISVVPVDAENSANLGRIVESDPELSLRREELFAEYSHRAGDIRQELIELSDHISTVKLGTPLIVLGDFNTTVNSVEMKEFLRATKLFDAAASAGEGNIVTWDAERNTNTRFSRASVDARGSRLSPLELLSASYDERSRRIDHVFLSRAFEDNDVKSVKTVLDTPQTGLFASDHYGILAELSIGRLLSVQPTVSDSVEQVEGSTVEPFPILSYDTDVGFGYGAKLFLLNSFGRNESFDAVLFNSTKGERWYRFVFSLPDFEVRQGKIYPIAVDLAVDYDKYLKNSFFGVGNGSKFEDREYYTREPLEVSLMLSRGFSQHEVGQLGLKYKSVRNFNFSDTSRLEASAPELNSGIVRYHSLVASYRFDSRNSFINPSRGWVIQAEAEYAPQSGSTNVRFGRLGGWVQYYATLFYPKTIFAFRFGAQGLLGHGLPVQVLLPIGGNQTLRGSPQDRFLDRNSGILNAEVRFPIFWRFGGVLGYDAGKVWGEPAKADLIRWATNPVAGLRFFMETFVVRMDLGFGRETTGFYLNFGHLF